MCRLATKCTEKNERKKTRTYFLRQTIKRVLVVLRSVIHWLRELWLEWIEFGCVHKVYQVNWIGRTSRSRTCNRNRFDSLPEYRTWYAVRSAITATAELLVVTAADRVTCQSISCRICGTALSPFSLQLLVACWSAFWQVWRRFALVEMHWSWLTTLPNVGPGYFFDGWQSEGG